MTSDASYYTVSDHGAFIGTVALLNSLRVTGHAGKLHVLDIGLTAGERRFLERAATVVSLPTESAPHPWLLKPYPHLLEPSGTVVLVDSDIIVTRSLGDLIALSEEGKICVYPDPPATRDRWFSEWRDALSLRAPLRPATYVNAGFVLFSVDRWPELLSRWWETCERLPAGQVSSWGPFYAGEQDALNALLMSEVPRAAVALLPADEATLGSDVRVDDPRTLRSSRDGRPITILHYGGRPKPWHPSGWTRLTGRAYIDLIPRLLFMNDVPLQLEPGDVPPWLRPGFRGNLLRASLGPTSRTAARLAATAPDSLRRRLRALRTRVGELYDA